MKSRYLLTCLFITGTSFAAGPHWAYDGAEGPDHWAKLSPDYAACAGKNQSPINLTGFIEAELGAITFNYSVAGNSLVNNGHTLQLNFPEGNTIMLDGVSYALKQFHFHAPSENLIQGKSYPLEMHLAHADKDGNLAVIAVMFEEGKANPALAIAFANPPHEEGETATLTQPLSAGDLLPVNRDYYRFNGSLTTPPCTEGVRWLVMKNSLSASKAQIDTFMHTMHHATNRPTQPVNARPVLQ